MNTLIRLLEAFPDDRWDFDALAGNPNISLEYIDEHPELRKGIYLLNNPNITIKYILDHPEIIRNNNAWQNISRNPGITLFDIENNPELPWDWKLVGDNPNIDMNFILKNRNHFDLKINCTYLGSQSNITLENIVKYPEFFFEKNELSRNPNLTFDFIVNHFSLEDYTWNWFSIGSRTKMPIEDIYNEYPDLFKRDSFQLGLSYNPNVSLEDIKKYITIHDYGYMWRNSSITMEDIDTFDKIDYNCVSYNPNITYEWVVKNSEEINFDSLSRNKFAYHEDFEDPIIIRV